MVARAWGVYFEYFKYKGMMLELVRYTYYLKGKYISKQSACLDGYSEPINLTVAITEIPVLRWKK